MKKILFSITFLFIPFLASANSYPYVNYSTCTGDFTSSVQCSGEQDFPNVPDKLVFMLGNPDARSETLSFQNGTPMFDIMQYDSSGNFIRMDQPGGQSYFFANKSAFSGDYYLVTTSDTDGVCYNISMGDCLDNFGHRSNEYFLYQQTSSSLDKTTADISFGIGIMIIVMIFGIIVLILKRK